MTKSSYVEGDCNVYGKSNSIYQERFYKKRFKNNMTE